MVQSSLNLAVVAVTDDVMPIAEVLQVFPVAVWGTSGTVSQPWALCLGCFWQRARDWHFVDSFSVSF